MTIKRFETGPRMSQAVVHNGTVYLAGQVAKGASVKEQTTAILKQIDAPAGRGRHGQIEAPVRHHLAHGHRPLQRNELGLGSVGVAGQHAGARLRGIEARRARLPRRNRRHLRPLKKGARAPPFPFTERAKCSAA